MKLKYQIVKKTELNTEAIKWKIISGLRDSDYKIDGSTENTISFIVNTSGWTLTSNQVSTMDEGIFELLESENEKYRHLLTYYLSLTVNWVLLTIFLLLGFFFDYWILVLAGGLVIFTVISLGLTKIQSTEMLDKITGDI